MDTDANSTLSFDQKQQLKKSTGRKRNKQETEADMAIVSERYLRGDTHDQIARYISSIRPYSLTRKQISLDIENIHKRWIAAQLIDFDEARARELSKLDKIEGAAWEGWERSLTQQEVIESIRIEDNASAVRMPKATTYTRNRYSKKQQAGIGDIKFLDIVLKCVQERCKILGIHAPQQLNVSWREEAQRAGIDPEKFENGLVEQFVNAAKMGRDSGSGRLE